MDDIVFIAIASVLSGGDSWNDMQEYGEIKKEWLSSFLELPNGIPSHDTFNRFFLHWMLMYLRLAFYHG